MHLIIVGGQTCTGKTTLSRRLIADLSIRSHLKDDYKEAELFSAYSRPLSLAELYRAETASWDALYAAVEAAQRKDNDLLIEGNFTAAQKKRLQRMIYADTTVIELFLYTRGYVMWRRYMARNKSGERHAGHRDHLWYWIVWLEAFCAQLGWRWLKPLRLSTNVLPVDATDLSRVDYTAAYAYITQRMR